MLPYNQTQSSTQVSDMPDQRMKGSLQVNQLVYKQPSNLTVVTDRTQKISTFQRSTYSNGETMVMDVNTGTDFIDPNRSGLYFSFSLDGTGGALLANFGSGSTLNTIRDVSIRTRSGVDLGRDESVNVYRRLRNKVEYGADWFRSVGINMGYGPTQDGTADAGSVSDGVRTNQFFIPLSQLHGIFRPLNRSHLVPGQLFAGAHIEILLESDFAKILFDKASVGTITGYTLRDVRLEIECVTLSEDVQKTLNLQSANAGLEFCYERYFTSKTSQAGSALDVNLQIRKSCSQATGCLTVGIEDRSDIATDGLTSIFRITSYLAKVGQNQYPFARGASTVEICEGTAYSQLLGMFDKIKLGSCERTAMNRTDYRFGWAMLGTNFSKSSLPMSGVNLNNSRSLEVSWTNSATYTNNVTYYNFLSYISVAKIYLSNVAVAV